MCNTDTCASIAASRDGIAMYASIKCHPRNTELELNTPATKNLLEGTDGLRRPPF